MSTDSATQPGAISHLLRVRNAIRSAVAELRVPSAKRIPFLDGLRTIAILLVLNHHVAAAYDSLYTPSRYTNFPLTLNGWMGVDLFFVLSGFFIGSQLWKELARTGSVNLGEFMLRRTLRIWPLYFFTYAAVLLSLPQFGAAKQYGWADVVFLVNYLGKGVVLGGWSLSTEEQFYLVAPLLILLFRRHTLRWFRWMLGGLWLLEVAVRIAEYVHMAGGWRVKNAAAFNHLYYPFHTHSDGLIVGLLIANLIVAAGQRGIQPLQRRSIFTSPWFVLVLGVVGMGVCWKLQSETLNFAGLGLLFGSVVWWGIHIRPQWLSSRFFYLGSRLSFGMYLNHPYLIQPVTRLVVSLHMPPPAWAAPLTALIVACLSAALSFLTFCVIEHPFLLLRTLILRRKIAVPLVAH